jgi:hypothetical protein
MYRKQLDMASPYQYHDNEVYRKLGSNYFEPILLCQARQLMPRQRNMQQTMLFTCVGIAYWFNARKHSMGTLKTQRMQRMHR